MTHYSMFFIMKETKAGDAYETSATNCNVFWDIFFPNSFYFQ